MRYCKQVKGDVPSHLLSTDKATSGELCLLLGSPTQETCGHTGKSPDKGHEGTEASHNEERLR